MADKRFFWLKLERNFFNRHDVKALRKLGGINIPYVYLRMLLESVDHDGELRFSPDIPYDAELLSSVFEDFDVAEVEKTITLTKKLGLISVLEDGTIKMTKFEKMVGSESADAVKQRYYRGKRQTSDNVVTNSDIVTECHNNEEQCHIEKEKEKEKEIEKDKVNDKSLTFKREKSLKPLPDFPHFESIFEKSFGYNPSDLRGLYDYIKKNNIKDWKLAMVNWATGGKHDG